MFKIESIRFINGNDFQTYKFSPHTFVYGLNTVGKTALTKAIDYVLGSSDGLTYQGLDNIEGIEAYLTNGLSMTRQTHLQMLTYLCMFEYLKENFCDFIHLPILIIDSANQPMGIEIFKEVYPTITQLADSIGIQTIFMSKDRLDNIPENDLIDISAGLNKFHKKS